MTSTIAESTVEEATLEWFEELGYEVRQGPEIAPGEPGAERGSYADVILEGRLRRVVEELNPDLPTEAVDEALRRVRATESPSVVINNRRFHEMLVDGVEVEIAEEGSVRGERVRLVDFNDPENNDWLVVNQFTVVEGRAQRRPDVLVFLNGLPVALLELKNPADEKADIWKAFKQIETYKEEIPSLFTYNGVLVISDGMEARVGSLTANREWFMPWRTVEGENVAPPTDLQLEVLLRGVLDKERFLDLLRHFIVFEQEGDKIAKKIAAYHQFHATRKALESTVEAASDEGDRRGGVVWHTQGSGKSLTMVFFSGKLVLHPALRNPTIVVITDRRDLDDQLFGTFSRCSGVLRQDPVKAKDRAHLKELLEVASGGVVFTTIQKFFPEKKGDAYPKLSGRSNIVVIADEAHRSQYEFIDGFARHMRDALPHATFVGFTGTPLELEDRHTRRVFGDYISVYDIQRAVEDGATVPIYYESRLAKIALPDDEKPRVDEEFEEVTEGEEVERKEKLKTKWARLENVVGSQKRLRIIARDLVEHFERRLEAMDGKAMVVGMSRRICVDLYNEIVELRPDWHDDEDEGGIIKVVMTGSASDPTEWQQHIRNKRRRDALARRFKDPEDPFKIGIVRDMWLTGFDAPSLHTMYVDKPMRGHTLMQAIARVNRVYKDKPGGLIVDYIGIAPELRKALATYAESGGKGETAIDQEEAVRVMLEKYEICCELFDGFDYSAYKEGSRAEGLKILPAAQEHILAQDEGKERFIQAVTELSKAFALAVPRDEAIAIRDEVGFFQTVKAAIVKSTATRETPEEELDHAINQIVSRALSSGDVVDIFDAAGLEKPEISILSDDFLVEVRDMPQKNLAVEVLRKLLNDEIKTKSRTQLVQSRRFSEMLEKTILRYENRSVETAQVIEELITLAKEMRDAHQRGEEIGLSEEEIAFYDALATNGSAVEVLGNETLREMARKIAETVRKNTTIDWTLKETARAKLRVLVKRLLRRYGYPPDKQEAATKTVLEQAELMGYEHTRK